MPQVFVYGTLRKGASAEKLMQNARLVEQGRRLDGYRMFNFGPYPFVVPDASAGIVGDMFEVEEEDLPKLDEYEGPEYTRNFDTRINAYIYVKSDGGSAGYPEVSRGDWLERRI